MNGSVGAVERDIVHDDQGFVACCFEIEPDPVRADLQGADECVHRVVGSLRPATGTDRGTETDPTPRFPSAVSGGL